MIRLTARRRAVTKFANPLNEIIDYIGPNDLMIAAIAVANDLILITNNTREFSRVQGLQIDDWHED